MHPRTLARRLQSVVTGSDGRYRVVQLQPGPYQVAAELQGFSMRAPAKNLDVRLSG